jgi:hypothetical protein
MQTAPTAAWATPRSGKARNQQQTAQVRSEHYRQLSRLWLGVPAIPSLGMFAAAAACNLTVHTAHLRLFKKHTIPIWFQSPYMHAIQVPPLTLCNTIPRFPGLAVCVPGYGGVAGNIISCTECPVGSHSTGGALGSTNCTACPVGSTTPGKASQSAADCSGMLKSVLTVTQAVYVSLWLYA